MRFPLRYLALTASAVAFCGALVMTSGAAVTTASPRAVQASHVSARFLAEARGALVSYLRSSHPTAQLVHPARAGASTTAAGSYNWSGYVDTSTTHQEFSQVAGSWTTPAVTCTAEDTITSEWVGLDGWTGSSTVEQDGTISWCYKDKPVYFTWYEMYPAGTIEVGTALKPGDKIAASVVRTGTSYKLSLTDSTNTANSFAISKTCAAATCVDTSAEWIAERSAFSIGIAPLADYKTWTRAAATETAAGKSGTISSFKTNDSITMVDATDVYDLSTVSALTGGNAFTTTWKNSY